MAAMEVMDGGARAYDVEREPLCRRSQHLSLWKEASEAPRKKRCSPKKCRELRR